jgi:hypothetical protein
MPIFLILLRKIKKMGIHSKYSLTASAAKVFLRQARGCTPRPFQRGALRPWDFLHNPSTADSASRTSRMNFSHKQNSGK